MRTRTNQYIHDKFMRQLSSTDNSDSYVLFSAGGNIYENTVEGLHVISTRKKVRVDVKKTCSCGGKCGKH